MARVIAVGAPVNDGERQAIATLRDGLSNEYVILHNFEVHRNAEAFEVDIAVVAPHAVYLVDAKGTRGFIDVYGSKWYPEGRSPYTSPLLKLRSHARTLKGLITESQPGRPDLQKVYVDAVVLLTSLDATLQDPAGRDRPDVTTLKKACAFFQNSARIPTHFSKNIKPAQSMVLRAIQGAARKRSGPLQFGNWEVQERLGGVSGFTEYRAANLFAGSRAGTVRLRVYEADPYLPETERAAQRLRIANAFEALNKLPPQPNIAGARDFFATEAEDRFILVLDDVPSQALRVYLEKPKLVLTIEQKLQVAKAIMAALKHAHAHGVVHRNLNPGDVLLGTDGICRLTGFDYARVGEDRTHTIAQEISDELEREYMAPEVLGEPSAASGASDVFSAGLLIYELFTGEKAFSGPTAVFDCGAVFPDRPSAVRGEVPAALDEWLQALCTFEPEKRPSSAEALRRLDGLIEDSAEASAAASEESLESLPELDYANLPAGTQLTSKYVVEQRLGRPGSFGVVYKVIDTLGDVSRAVKLILRDRHSTLERLKKEYRTLLRIPEHPHVVRVIDADVLPAGGPPFIVFDYVDGLDVGEMIDDKLFSPDDALLLARQAGEGLVHLHASGCYHCDIKPRNLLWTTDGAKIIDFNVSVHSAENGHGGGSRRYLPPDLHLASHPMPSDLADRDLYALGLTLYEAITGRYPWESAVPPAADSAPDPRELSGLADLHPKLVEVVLKSIAPKRADRFDSATEYLSALVGLTSARRDIALPQLPTASTLDSQAFEFEAARPNTNPFVSYLITLYSQSTHTNAGTRGLTDRGEALYVETALDRELAPAVLAGQLRLVLITGNAGDGKTAFLQRLERRAEQSGAVLDHSPPNGCRFTVNGISYLSNYDGSQDEDDRRSDAVLEAFLSPFAGDDPEAWSADEVRLIAINEGRLVDFLTSHAKQFAHLEQLVQRGLASGEVEDGVAVVNLNLRSVVAPSDEGGASILRQLLGRMTDETLWRQCAGCDLADRCYALHNARTFQDPTAGDRVAERLEVMYTLAHLRGQLHMTLRDVGSAMAFTITSGRTCDEIHALHDGADRKAVIDSYYFNSWMGGETGSADRLLSYLAGVDVGLGSDAQLDRVLDFTAPGEDHSLFHFDGRSTYLQDVVGRLYTDLPRDASGQGAVASRREHQRFVRMLRRRKFFERRDARWRSMLPYESADRLLGSLRGEVDLDELLSETLVGINRGEGLASADVLAGSLALQVRQVDRGTVRSYRLFPSDRFRLAIDQIGASARFVEHMPAGLELLYSAPNQLDARLVINLDVFEMIHRLNEGYRPTVEEQRGFYVSLEVFKNVLGSAPYQEVLLTTTGHDFYGIERQSDGRLELSQLTPGGA